MELDLKERLGLLNLLPNEGDYIALCLRESVVKKVSLLPEEVENWGVTVEGNSFNWEEDKAEVLEYEFSNSELEFVKKVLRELDANKKLTVATMELYKKFITNPKGDEKSTKS